MSTISSFGTLVDTVKRQYKLPEIVEVVPIPSPRSNSSGEETIYRLVTNTKSYVLRQYRTESADRIELHNHFLHWAAKTKYPLTQRLIPTSDGADFIDFSERKWWLALFIEADEIYAWTNPTWTHNNCQYAGTALSSLHETLRLYAKQEKFKTENTASIVPTLEAKLMKASANAPQFHKDIHGVVPIVRKALEVLRRGDRRRTQLVHGDFHPGNILYRDSRAVAVIDFEYLHTEEPIYDLAYALIMFCARWSEGGDDGQIDIGLMQSFLKGYGKLDSHSLLLPYMRISAAVCLAWLLERELDREKALHFVNILKHLQNFSTIDFSPASN